MIVSSIDNGFCWWLTERASSNWEAPATRIWQCWVFDGLRAALSCAPDFVVAESVVMGGEFAHSSERIRLLAAAVAVVVVVVAGAAAAVIVLAAVVMRVVAAVVVVPTVAIAVVAACVMLFLMCFRGFCG